MTRSAGAQQQQSVPSCREKSKFTPASWETDALKGDWSVKSRANAYGAKNQRGAIPAVNGSVREKDGKL